MTFLKYHWCYIVFDDTLYRYNYSAHHDNSEHYLQEVPA